METGGPSGLASVATGEGEEGRNALGLFEYIERLHQRSPVFYNLLYTPDLDNPVCFFILKMNILNVFNVMYSTVQESWLW